MSLIKGASKRVVARLPSTVVTPIKLMLSLARCIDSPTSRCIVETCPYSNPHRKVRETSPLKNAKEKIFLLHFLFLSVLHKTSIKAQAAKALKLALLHF